MGDGAVCKVRVITGFNGAAVDERRKFHSSSLARRKIACFNGAAVDERRKMENAVVRHRPVTRFNGAAVDERRKLSIRCKMPHKADQLQWGRRR